MKEATQVNESRLAESKEKFEDPSNHVFRKAYRQLTDGEKILMDALKDKAFEVHKIIKSVPAGREQALALTNLEQSVMWAVKAITG